MGNFVVEGLSDDELCRRLIIAAGSGRLHQKDIALLEAAIAIKKMEQLSERAAEQLERNLVVHGLLLPPVKPVEVKAGPPRFIEGIFWFVLPRKVREAVMGDAAEAYAETMKRCGDSRFWASVDYCKEAVFAIIGSMQMSAAQWISHLFRRSS
jgi:hypothetical protein